MRYILTFYGQKVEVLADNKHDAIVKILHAYKEPVRRVHDVKPREHFEQVRFRELAKDQEGFRGMVRALAPLLPWIILAVLLLK